MVCDAGKELIVVYQIGAPAPWQNGKTERYGAHFKDLLEKARAEMVITEEAKLRRLMHMVMTEEAKLRRLMQKVESVKNRFANRSGFSPTQS